MTNFQSPLYQQYASYLQKTQGGVGMNSLLAPLMAGGGGYTGGQAIAQQQMQGMNAQRQDKINTGVQGFAMNMQNNVMGQLGQIGDSFQNTLNRKMQEGIADQANSPFAQLGGMLGSLAGMFNPFQLGAAKSSGGGVGGYNG